MGGTLMRAWFWKYLLVLGALLVWTAGLKSLIRERSAVSVLKEDAYRTSDFREQYVLPQVYRTVMKAARPGSSPERLLTTVMLWGEFFPKKITENDLEEILAVEKSFLRYKKEEFLLLQKAYEAVWADVSCFPVSGGKISYEDSFGEPRDYGGSRIHEGTDLFGERKEPGYYPVHSMTDGTVEKVGWLPLGGYRIGIRAPSGGYFYYAHLSEYDRDFQEGETVQAGDILGFMGDTGYGQEGTRGRFPVHLHLGIYIRTPWDEEMSVNPYYVLLSVL